MAVIVTIAQDVLAALIALAVEQTFFGARNAYRQARVFRRSRSSESASEANRILDESLRKALERVRPRLRTANETKLDLIRKQFGFPRWMKAEQMVAAIESVGWKWEPPDRTATPTEIERQVDLTRLGMERSRE